MNVSSYFGTGVQGHALYDFVDVNLDSDNKVFIDPALIDKGNDEWSKNARTCLNSFFDSLYAGFKTGDVQKLLLHAHEQNAAKLGYGNGFNGKGKTPTGLDICFRDLGSLVHQIPTISTCEDLPVFVKGFAEDCMTDLLTNILHKQFNEFTALQMQKMGVPPNCTSKFWTWSVEEGSWVEEDAPCWTYKEQEILLIPKWIVRKNYLFKAHQYLMTVIIERIRFEQVKDDFTKKDIWQSLGKSNDHWEYDQVVSYSKDHPDALLEYHRKIPYYYNRAKGQMSDDELDICIYGAVVIQSA